MYNIAPVNALGHLQGSAKKDCPRAKRTVLRSPTAGLSDGQVHHVQLICEWRRHLVVEWPNGEVTPQDHVDLASGSDILGHMVRPNIDHLVAVLSCIEWLGSDHIVIPGVHVEEPHHISSSNL